jgi:hypothetical protein
MAMFAYECNKYVVGSDNKNLSRRLFLMACYVATLCASGLASFSPAPASLECSVPHRLADWLLLSFVSLQDLAG